MADDEVFATDEEGKSLTLADAKEAYFLYLEHDSNRYYRVLSFDEFVATELDTEV